MLLVNVRSLTTAAARLPISRTCAQFRQDLLVGCNVSLTTPLRWWPSRWETIAPASWLGLAGSREEFHRLPSTGCRDLSRCCPRLFQHRHPRMMSCRHTQCLTRIARYDPSQRTPIPCWHHKTCFRAATTTAERYCWF